MSEPRKYRRRAALVDAVQWDGTKIAADAIIGQIRAGGVDATYGRVARSASRYNTEYDYQILIEATVGLKVAKPGDWIVYDPHLEGAGRFDRYSPEVFEATYEAVDLARMASLSGLETAQADRGVRTIPWPPSDELVEKVATAIAEYADESDFDLSVVVTDVARAVLNAIGGARDE